MVLRETALRFSLAAAAICGGLFAAPLSVDPSPHVTNENYAEFPSTSAEYETPLPEPPSTTGGCGEPPQQTNCYKCPDCSDGRWMCYVIDCGPVTCVDPVYTPGQCCPRCPNGPNCKINNEIVGFGQSVTLGDGQVCFCLSDVSWEAPEAKCLVTVPPLPDAPTHELWSPPPSEPPCEADTPLIPGMPVNEYPPQNLPEQPTPPEPTKEQLLPAPEEPTALETTATTTTPRKNPKATAKKTPAPPKKKTPAPPKKKTTTPPKKTPKPPKTTTPKIAAARTPKRSPKTTPKKTTAITQLITTTTPKRAPKTNREPKVVG